MLGETAHFVVARECACPKVASAWPSVTPRMILQVRLSLIPRPSRRVPYRTKLRRQRSIDFVVDSMENGRRESQSRRAWGSWRSGPSQVLRAESSSAASLTQPRAFRGSSCEGDNARNSVRDHALRGIGPGSTRSRLELLFPNHEILAEFDGAGRGLPA